MEKQKSTYTNPGGIKESLGMPDQEGSAGRRIPPESVIRPCFIRG
jgi:hypothetical protein